VIGKSQKAKFKKQTSINSIKLQTVSKLDFDIWDLNFSDLRFDFWILEFYFG